MDQVQEDNCCFQIHHDMNSVDYIMWGPLKKVNQMLIADLADT